MTRLFLVLAALSLSAPAFADDAKPDAPKAEEAPAKPAGPKEANPHGFTAIAAPDHVKLGENFVYTVEIRHAPNERYELPKDLSLGDEFNVIKVETQREKKGDESVTRFVITAALFDLGEKKIPDLKVSVSAPGEAQQFTVPGPPVIGEGELKPDEEAKLYDILPPVDVKVPDYRALYIIAAAFAAGVLSLMAWRWWKNRPVKAPVVKLAPRLPAHERAYAALTALQSENLPAQGRDQEFFFRLSEILRDYLGERFGFTALDMTTEELLATLQRLPTPGLDYAKFEALCREGDLVKFAKVAAGPTQCKAAIDQGFAIVQATTVITAPPSAAKAAPASPPSASKRDA